MPAKITVCIGRIFHGEVLFPRFSLRRDEGVKAGLGYRVELLGMEFYHPVSLQAVGLGARFLKLGGLSRGERVAKYNRLLAIEEELAANGALRTSFFLTLFSACREYGHKDWREND